MLLKRENALALTSIFEVLNSKKFNVRTQYKFIKIKKAIEEERIIYQEQISLNCQDFFEKDENGNIKMNNQGGFKIKEGKINECQEVIRQIN